MSRLSCLLLVVPAVSFAEGPPLLPILGVGIGIGANTSSGAVEAPFVIFGGASLVREEQPRAETRDGPEGPVTVIREPVVPAWGGELVANLLLSGRRPATFEPVLSALLTVLRGPTVTLGAGPTVNLEQPAVDGAIVSASFGARSLIRVQADLRVGASQPRLDLGLRLDLMGVGRFVFEIFRVMRAS